MTPSVPVGEVRPLGDRALLVGVDDAVAARALAPALEVALTEAGIGGTEVVCGFATVAVLLNDAGADLADAHDAVGRVLSGTQGVDAPPAPPGRAVRVPCVFDGPDLDEVASLAGCAPAQVPGLLTARPLTVAVVGFSPGFAYLDGLPAPLARVPRRARPRPAVPAGSVALANGHAAVYPTASPGGWHLVGRTSFPLFSVAQPPYAVLAPGDTVRFAVAAADDASGDGAAPMPVTPPAWSPPRGARPVLEVVAPGLRAVLQDAGRRGVAAVGVPGAGPADPVSFALANALVGNAADAGTVELTGGGTRLACVEPCHVGVVGAAPEVRVDGGAVPDGQLVPLAPGQVLDVRALRHGCRSYVAVAGGLLGPTVFGSSASDELCRLGAGPLEAGRVIWAGTWAPPLGDHLVAGASSALADGAVTLRVLPGPHPEWFRADALTRLGDVEFRVAPESNRVGIRLRAVGDAADVRAAEVRSELDSQCVVTGALQVPPDGEPVVLLPDHATLGGYPALAVVAAADHGLLGQCGPGTFVHFVVIGPEEAEEARRSRQRVGAGAVVGHYPLSAG